MQQKKLNLVPKKKIKISAEKIHTSAKKTQNSTKKIQKRTNRAEWILSKQVSVVFPYLLRRLKFSFYGQLPDC